MAVPARPARPKAPKRRKIESTIENTPKMPLAVSLEVSLNIDMPLSSQSRVRFFRFLDIIIKSYFSNHNTSAPLFLRGFTPLEIGHQRWPRFSNGVAKFVSQPHNRLTCSKGQNIIELKDRL